MNQIESPAGKIYITTANGSLYSFSVINNITLSVTNPKRNQVITTNFISFAGNVHSVNSAIESVLFSLDGTNFGNVDGKTNWQTNIYILNL